MIPQPPAGTMLSGDSGVSISLALLILAGLAGLWWRIEARFNRAADDRHRIESELKEAVHDVDSDLARYKTHVAETYMSKLSGGAAIDRAVAEIKGLRADLREDIIGLRSDVKRVENHIFKQAGG